MANPRDVSPARLAAFEILRRVEDGAFSSVLLAAREPALEGPDRALCHELVMGVLRWRLFLDRIIEHFTGRKVSSLDLAVQLSLRLGLYQLRFLSRVPASAAVNESVKLVGHARLRSAQALANAVLRRATRDPEYDPAAEISDSLERLAIETSHPAWLLGRWIKAFGLEQARLLARADNLTPPTAIRVVHWRASESQVLVKLRAAEAVVVASAISPGAWRVTGATSLLQEMAARAEIYLQDEASQLVAHVLEPRADERVLDLCAAPGGKTTQIADLTNDRALIVAGDLAAPRLKTLSKTVSVQQFRSVRLVRLNAERPLPFSEGAFDRVLVDAPCSGTGTMRRNPEIRWRVSATDIQNFSIRQERILLNASSAVKRGGRLVYSTCSVEPEENEEVVRSFLGRNPGFSRIPISVEPSLLTGAGEVRTWPQHHGTDGFFVAAFLREM